MPTSTVNPNENDRNFDKLDKLKYSLKTVPFCLFFVSTNVFFKRVFLFKIYSLNFHSRI